MGVESAMIIYPLVSCLLGRGKIARLCLPSLPNDDCFVIYELLNISCKRLLWVMKVSASAIHHCRLDPCQSEVILDTDSYTPKGFFLQDLPYNRLGTTAVM